MAICDLCDQEMKRAASCTAYGDVDLTVIHGTGKCHDCGVMPGGCHHSGCDLERCSSCLRQWISCGCEDHDPTKARWTGEYPGKAECRALGFWCRDFHGDGSVVTGENPINWDKEFQWEDETGKPRRIKFHVPCKADDPGAHEDLNRLAVYQQTAARA